jgi:hypothetical protein
MKVTSPVSGKSYKVMYEEDTDILSIGGVRICTDAYDSLAMGNEEMRFMFECLAKKRDLVKSSQINKKVLRL